MTIFRKCVPILVAVISISGCLVPTASRAQTDGFLAANDTASTEQKEVEPWRFIVMADIHNSEAYLHKKGVRTDTKGIERLQENQIKLYSEIHDVFGGDFVLMPGDMMNGRTWAKRDFIGKMGYPAYWGTLHGAIDEFSDVVFGNIVTAFREGGYPDILVALGDHEVGDNDWSAKSRKAYAVEYFKTAFARHFVTVAAKNYSEAKGDFSSFNQTNYAVRHKNAVFITLDEFYQASPKTDIGPHGSVAGTISQEQQDWLETVLIAARENPSIEYIFVQGHLPVLQPVRVNRSSNMAYEDGPDSALWKLLQEYEVDLYFNGEVHANTVRTDPDSRIVQISSRGGRPNSMMMVVDVLPGEVKAKMEAYDRKSKTFTSVGELTVPERGEPYGTGILRPIDATKLIVDWRAEDAQQTDKALTFENRGEFRPFHSSNCEDCSVSDTEFGQGLLLADAKGVVFSEVFGAFQNSFNTTIDIEFSPGTEQGELLLSDLKYQGWNDKFKGVSIATFSDGLEIASDGTTVFAEFPEGFNKAQKYALELVHRTDGLLSEVEIYVDGKRLHLKDVEGEDKSIRTSGVEYSFAIGGGAQAGDKYLEQNNYHRFGGTLYAFQYN
ncbi:MAG: metallophosphoesterase family protein [Marinosulfonomonas sp.]